MSKNKTLDLLKTLFKDTNDCIFIFDADLNICFISEPFKLLIPELKINQKISEFFDAEWQNTYSTIICGFDSNITPILDEQEKICLYVLKTSSKYTIPSYEYPFSSDVSRSAIKNLSQRFYTPLTILFSSFIFFNRTLPIETFDEKTIKTLRTTKRNFYLLLKLLGNISDIASINPYDINTELSLKNINIVDFIKKTSSSINDFSTQLNIPIILNIRVDLSVYISVDIRKLEKILLILISNCFKYTKENNQIIISLNETLNHISISISDKGIGMNKETINNIFSPHRSNELKNKLNGSSLIIAKTFIEQMGGTMIIESTQKVGTKISFTISKNLTSGLNLSSTRSDPVSQGLFATKHIEFCDIIEHDEFV